MTTREWNDRMIDDLAERTRDDIRELGKKIDKQNEKLDALANSQKFTSAQWTTMIVTGITAAGAVLAAVLTGGPA